MKIRITIDVEYEHTGMDDKDLFLSIIDREIAEAINEKGLLQPMDGSEIKDWVQDYAILDEVVNKDRPPSLLEFIRIVNESEVRVFDGADVNVLYIKEVEGGFEISDNYDRFFSQTFFVSDDGSSWKIRGYNSPWKDITVQEALANAKLLLEG